MFTNSLMPNSDSSRPKPDALTPPNGSRGSDLTMPLMKTEPASIARRQLFASARSARPDGGPQAESGVVGDAQGVFLVVGGDQGGHGAEQFLVVGRHAGLHVVQDGRLEIKAGPLAEPLAAGQNAGAAPHRSVDLAFQLLQQVGPGQRPQVVAFVQGIPGLQPGHGGNERLLEAAVDRPRRR